MPRSVNSSALKNCCAVPGPPMKSPNITVYLVEDSPIITKLLTELIETNGARVVGHADTASKALGDIASLRPDAVTIDISLKRGTGFDVLEGIAINSEKDPPARIVLTNFTNDAYREAATQLGADHFFDKARQIAEMLDTLASIAQRKRTHEALAA